MSNLIVRSQSPAGESALNSETARTNVLPESSDDGITLRELWKSLLRRRKLAAITAGVVFVLILANATHHRVKNPLFAGGFTLLISDPLGDELGRSSATAGRFEQLALNTTSIDIPTLIEVLRSPLLLNPTATELGISSSSLAGRITITQGRGAGILQVRVVGREPDETGRAVKLLSTAYLQAAQQQRQQRLADGLEFLNQQAPELEARTSELQNKLAQFRIQNSVLEPVEEAVALKSEVANVDQQLLALELERKQLQATRRQVQEGTINTRNFQQAITGNGETSSEISLSDPDLAFIEQFTEVEKELWEARSRFSSSSLIVTGLETRLKQLQPLFRSKQLEMIDRALKLNAQRRISTNQQLEALKSEFPQKLELIKQFDSLQGNLTIAQQNLAGLVSARETFQLEIAQSAVPWRLLIPPSVNPNPIGTSLNKNLLQGAALALIAGVGAGLLRDRFDHVFHHPGDAKDDLGLPLLGHIPHVEFFQGVREDKRFLLRELDRTSANNSDDDHTHETIKDETNKQESYQRFFYQEAFRNLFTSLRFLNSDKPVRSIVLSSSLPSEGKSLVNVLLAKTLSEMGQRVLLVDADLRKPQIHTRLGLNNLSGLSNLLAEDDQHWKDVVQGVSGYDNWSVITSGRRPPDPTRLLSSKRMHALVEEVAEGPDFDLVLFDTPPVLGLADAALVAEHCDGLMLLVSLRNVDRGLPKEAVARIVSSGAPLLGLVTNSIKPEQQTAAYGYGRYGYGNYGFGYGYGYGHATFNSAAAYSHYADTNENDAEESTTPTSPDSPSRSWRQTLKVRRRQFMRWIDK